MNPNDERWDVVFVSDTEKYGLIVRMNGIWQLMARGMARPAAERICERLNEKRRDQVYARE